VGKLGKILACLGLYFYLQLWLFCYAIFQCALSLICSSWGINIFTPTLVAVRVCGLFVVGAIVYVLLFSLSTFVRKQFFVTLLFWWLSSSFFCLTQSAVVSSLTFCCSRPLNLRLAGPSLHQAPMCYLPRICPLELNTAITTYLKSRGEEDRYSGLFPGFVCRLVVRDSRGTFKSYRVEAEKNSDAKLFFTNQVMLNNQVIALNSEQVIKLRSMLAILRPSVTQVKLSQLSETIFLEYQVAGQYLFVQGSDKRELAEIESMLAIAARNH
jgi:hypothetical protein